LTARKHVGLGERAEAVTGLIATSVASFCMPALSTSGGEPDAYKNVLADYTTNWPDRPNRQWRTTCFDEARGRDTSGFRRETYMASIGDSLGLRDVPVDNIQ
jgi:hypothetical protein